MWHELHAWGGEFEKSMTEECFKTFRGHSLKFDDHSKQFDKCLTLLLGAVSKVEEDMAQLQSSCQVGDLAPLQLLQERMDGLLQGCNEMWGQLKSNFARTDSIMTELYSLCTTSGYLLQGFSDLKIAVTYNHSWQGREASN